MSEIHGGDAFQMHSALCFQQMAVCFEKATQRAEDERGNMPPLPWSSQKDCFIKERIPMTLSPGGTVWGILCAT